MQPGIYVPDTGIYIKQYTSEKIRLNISTHTNSIIISPNKILNPSWDLANISELTKENLLELFEYKADVYLIGTGEKQKFPDMSVYNFCQQESKAVDFMNSSAACRTFNMLASEGRIVIAAIILE
ncbi:MAG: hypothetical protein ACJA0H_000879 [Francisellaceae bacterium]|jgi:uncharacterized protein